MERRVTRRRLETRQAGTVQALGAVKPLGSGERRCGQWGRGRLGAAIYSHLSTHGGLEEDTAQAEGVAGWEQPCTGGAQITVDWRTALRGLGAWRVGSCHPLVALNAVWFGALVAKSVSLPNAWLLLFLGAHSFTRCLIAYPTSPFFPFLGS
jgi:hypothetical protein